MMKSANKEDSVVDSKIVISVDTYFTGSESFAGVTEVQSLSMNPYRPVTRGVYGVRSHPPPPARAPKVRILILNIQVKECSRLN